MRRDLEELVPYCPKCGYNLTGLKDYRCPECGTPFDPVLLMKRQLYGPVQRWGRMAFDLFVLPVLASIGTLFVALTSVGVLGAMSFPILGVFYIVFLIQNGQRIRLKAAEACQSGEKSRLYQFVEGGGLGTALLLQIVPIALFWGIIAWLIIKYPPRLGLWP